MKKMIYWKAKAISLFAFAFLFLANNIVCAADQLTYGSTIRLRHKNSNRYLTALGEKYNHPGTSAQFAIACTKNQSAESTLWIVGAGVGGGDVANSARDGQLVNVGDVVSFRSVTQPYHLHSHGGIKSPASGQGEVTGFLMDWGRNKQGDNNDNWTFLKQPEHGATVQIKHLLLGWNLHSHDAHQDGQKLYIFNNDALQEVTTYGGKDSNDDWILEIVKSGTSTAKVTKNDISTSKVSQSDEFAGGNAVIEYGKILCIRSLKYGRTLWTHPANRHGGENYPPHDHFEILAGVADPKGDMRDRNSCNFFMLVNSNGKSGQVQYGDKVEILSLSTVDGLGWGGNYDAIQNPPRKWAYYPNSRWGVQHGEILVYRPSHPDAQTGRQLFKIVSTAGKSGAVHENDSINIVASNDARVWIHNDSRWGNGFFELLVGENPAILAKSDDRTVEGGKFVLRYPDQASMLPVAKNVYDQLKAMKIGDFAAGIAIPKNMFDEEMGEAISVGVGSKDGELEVWCVGTDAQLYRYDQYTMKPNPWMKMEAKDASGVAITPLDSVSISSDGAMCVLTAAGKAYSYNWSGKCFDAMQSGAGNENVKFDSIAVGNAHAIWAVDTNKNIYQYSDGKGWDLITQTAAADVAVSADGTVMAINTSGEVFTYMGSNKWHQMSGINLDSIAVASKDLAWGTQQGRLWKLADGKWQEVKDDAGKSIAGVEDVSVNAAGTVFLIDRDHGIWHKGDSGVAVVSTPSVAAVVEAAKTADVVAVATKPARGKKAAKRAQAAKDGTLKIADEKKLAKKAALKKVAGKKAAGKKAAKQAQRRTHGSKQAIKKKVAEAKVKKAAAKKGAKQPGVKKSAMKDAAKKAGAKHPAGKDAAKKAAKRPVSGAKKVSAKHPGVKKPAAAVL